MKFLDALKEKVLIFDGAMGTSIHTYDLSLDDYQGAENCPEILVTSRPEVIKEIHESFFKVGCDVVETDTFGGSPIVLAEFGLQDRAYELNKKAAELAREVADAYSKNGQQRYVSGSIGPTTKLPSLGHISFDEMCAAYYVQVSGLVDGGADCLQFETGQDLLQAKAAVVAMVDYFEKIGRRVPIITQVTIEAPPLGTMLVGTDISAALATLCAFPIDVIGINCATGPSEMIDPVHYLTMNTTKYVSCLPNAGLPENVNGQTVYKLTPDDLANSLKYFVNELGVNIIGGCCGTTPAHLKRVVEVVGHVAPKVRHPEYTPAAASIYTSVALHVDPAPLIIGERTNTNGSRKFKQLLNKEDWDGMVAMARDQEKEGAHVLDVCTAYVGRDEVKDMSTFIKRLNTELQIPQVVDSTEYPVLETALKLIAGRPIINSINLEDGVDKMLKKVRLIKRFGAATIALTIDENGMAKEAEKKLEIARRIYDLSLAEGLRPEDLIFDALTFTLSTGNEDDRKLGLATLDGIRMIKEALPGVKTVLGVSNISFGFDPHIRQILNSVFLHYAVEAGLDMAIVNAQKILPLYKIDEAERELHRKLVFDERTPDYDPLFKLLEYYQNTDTKAAKSVKNKGPQEIEDVLKERIIDGNRVSLEKDLDIALKKYAPLEIINSILLEGMKVVGELFGAGKMQLPFVLQSAETMKASVAYLEQFMEKVEGSHRGTMVLATVKGDVHDIGKNLVDIILSNNGYKVINLGIKQPIENIIASAIENNADCVGMSGLLVKSTVIMKENLEILNQRGIGIPVILGGAALTRRYVEEDCRRVYKGTLFYGQDAFDDLKIMEALANKDQAMLAKMMGAQPGQHDPDADDDETGAIQVLEKRTQPQTLDFSPGDETVSAASSKAPKNGSKPDQMSDVKRDQDTFAPPFWGSRVVEDVPLSEVFEYINETALIRGQWRVRQGDTSDAEYEELLDTKVRPVLRSLEKECIEKKLLVPKAVYGYFPVQADGNDLIVYKVNDSFLKRVEELGLDAGHVLKLKSADIPNLEEWTRFSFPRQDHARHLCISDFFHSRSEGLIDVLPAQIVTMGAGASVYSEQLFKGDKYTDYLYFHGLSVESAEGLAEVIHKRVREELGLVKFDAEDRSKFFQQGYRGTRYSFGYPACPNLEDQVQLFQLLEPERIAVSLSEEFMLVPEQSTSAIVVVHPEAKYFNVKRQESARV
ncbi:MAG: methionine synthase [Candidatus Obscuribacterales bacterium]|nr:methionine synthase [Candidatus Obscuribacterales bacterium]